MRNISIGTVFRFLAEFGLMVFDVVCWFLIEIRICPPDKKFGSAQFGKLVRANVYSMLLIAQLERI